MVFVSVYYNQPNHIFMFNKFKKADKPVNVIEGLPHTQLEEKPVDSTLEELFN